MELDLCNLTPLLAQAVDYFKKMDLSLDSVNGEIFFLIRRIADRPTDYQEHQVAKLYSALSKESVLEIFNNRMVISGHGAVRVTFSSLTEWLMKRAFDVGAPQAIKDLTQYVISDIIPAHLMIALGGLTFSGEYCLGDEIKLVNYDSFSNVFVKTWIAQRFETGLHWPTAIIMKPTKIRKKHLSAQEINAHQSLSVMGDKDSLALDDFLLCLGLIGPTAPCTFAKWVEFPEWAFVASSSFATPFLDTRCFPREMPIDAPKQATELFARWKTMNESEKSKIRVPMERLNKSIRRSSQVDSAIDLGIVLEALFLDDDNTAELSYRLQTRAAMWLGKNLSERKRIASSLKQLYDCRSKAVHTGKLLPEYKGKSTDQILENGFNLAATGIKRYLLEGKPDWDTVVFEGSLTPDQTCLLPAQ